MDFFLAIVIVLLALAALDLTVGVANDAVNFLNSAIGSKAAPLKVILAVAAAGVLCGALFSGGMMEIAKKGIFNPQFFVLSEVLLIFVAVMFTDVLLLDLFNTFGLPTSTTVSIVAGLFGSALGISIIKVFQSGESAAMLFEYLNTASILTIFTAILLSIVFAFLFGFLVQYITRMIFTFDYKLRLRRFGSVWGGLSLTALTFFILLKGAKGASAFLGPEFTAWVTADIGLKFLMFFAGWTAILQILMWLFKINLLKLIVLLGTFSLALSFAANDLVNFIGAPLAGLNSYQIALNNPDMANANMAELATKSIKADTWLLLLSGLIMVGTLFLSKKVRTVSRTEVSLGRQDEGLELFESNVVSRGIVRMFIALYEGMQRITPAPIVNFLARRFDVSKYQPEVDDDGKPQSFDLLRASVILMVASALISLGTSLKLPLSTTYVTFIVAMAAALPDKAWGRESAVYRVSGVVTVITGWIFTAFMAAAMSLIIAFLLYYTEIWGLAGMVLLTAFIIFRSAIVHKKRETEVESKELAAIKKVQTAAETIEQATQEMAEYLQSVASIVTTSYKGLIKHELKPLKKSRNNAKHINNQVNLLTKHVLGILKFSKVEDSDTELEITRAVSAFQDLADRAFYLSNQNYNYVDNNHHKLIDAQIEEIKVIHKSLEEFVGAAAQTILSQKASKFDELSKLEADIKDKLKKFNRSQLSRIKKTQNFMKRSMLYLNIITDTEDIVNATLRITHACRRILESFKLMKTGQKDEK